MTIFKRMLASLMCILIFTGILQVNVLAQGEEVNIVTDYFAGDCADTNVPESMRYGDGKNGIGYGYYAGLYITYNVEITKDGFYNVSADLSASLDKDSSIHLYIDGVEQKKVDPVRKGGAGNVLTNEFGEIFLRSGSYEFKILAGGSGDMEFFRMQLEFMGEDDGTKEVSYVYDSVNSEHTYGGSDVREETYPYTGKILGINGSYAQYSVNVPAGNYIISVCYGAYDSIGCMKLTINGETLGTYTLPQNDTFIHQANYDRNSYYKIETISLNEGENLIRFECGLKEDGVTSAPFSYTTFTLSRITEPSAQLYSGKEAVPNTKTAKFKDGDITVKGFLPAYMEGNVVDMLSCIYKDGVLYKMAKAKAEQAGSNTVLSSYFDSLEIEEESSYICKVFFWDTVEGMKPLGEYVVLGDKVYKNLYMSPEGSDSGTGDETDPFKTLSRVKEEIAKINDDMDGDIVVNILPGEYQISETEVLTEKHSGKNGYSVIFRGTDRDNKPVFSGGTKVTGWTQYNDYIWKAPFEGTGDIRNLYVNGFAAQRARSKYRYLPTVDYNIEGSGNINDGVGITEVNFPTSLSNPEDIELCWQNAWAFQITPVADIERKDGMVYFIMDQPYYNMARSRTFLSTAPGANRRFHIQNAFELLDEPGEFYYNKNEKMIYYYPFKAEVLNEAETVVGTTELMFSLVGSSAEKKVENIIFDNISVKYGAWNEVNKTGMIVDQADKIVDEMYSGTGAGGKMIPAQFDIKNASGIEIVNSEFSCLGSSAIAMSDGVSNSKIKGNQIHDISGSGIVIGHWDHNDNGNHPDYVNMTQCSDIDITNNVITRAAYEFKGCIGISVYYEKNINILHNYIKDTAYTGISLGWGWGEESDCDNIKVSYNVVENAVMPPVLDGGHIYTLGALRNSEISYNYFNGTNGEYGAIYPDSGSSYLEIHHNVVEGCNHWFFGGLYETHDINAHDNYSDTEKYFDYGATDEYEGENTIEAVKLIDTENRPQEATAIIEGAGLEAKYAHLSEGLSYPAWRTDFAKDAPKDNFVINDGTWYQAEDFCEGGQGVGYYKLRPQGNNTVYREGDVIMHRQEDDGAVLVGDTYPGEWLMYDIEIPYDGIYQITIKGAYVPYSEDEAPAMVNVYLDDVKIVENAEISATESWSIKLPNIVGTAEIKEGTHKLKVEFVQMGFAFDCFRIIDVEKADLPETTSPDYDEGIIVTEN